MCMPQIVKLSHQIKTTNKIGKGRIHTKKNPAIPAEIEQKVYCFPAFPAFF